MGYTSGGDAGDNDPVLYVVVSVAMFSEKSGDILEVSQLLKFTVGAKYCLLSGSRRFLLYSSRTSAASK